MNAFFLAMVVLGCALSVHAECSYPSGGDGGVFDKNEKYIPGNTKSPGNDE